MLKIKTFIGFLFLVYLLTGLLPCSVFAQTQAVIQQVKGRVEVFIENKWYRAHSGTMLGKNNKIRTFDRSYCILIFQDGHTLRISGNSEISLDILIKEITEIKLKRGRIRAKVKKISAGVKFGIRTPTAVCAVRGTDFGVKVEAGITTIEVYEGIVYAREEITGKEIQLNPGEFTIIELGKEPAKPEPIPEEKREEINKEDKETKKEQERQEVLSDAQKEIFYEISREAVIERSAEEIKQAEYQLGKSIIDAFGKRVRMEEYITRPQSNQFKYVVLNTREDRFDFGKILFTFNDTLPADLRDATRNMFYKEGAEKPLLYLTGVDSVMSNTIDQVNEIATDGDMVPDNPANPTSWSLFFSKYQFYVNTKKRWEFIDSNRDRRLSLTEFSFYDGAGNKLSVPPTYKFEMPSGENKFHFKQTDTYPDNFWISAEDYIINDDGKVLTLDEAKKWSRGEIKNKLEQLNFERVYTSSEFQGRKIDLVFSAKLLVDSGILSLPNPAEKLAQE